MYIQRFPIDGQNKNRLFGSGRKRLYLYISSVEKTIALKLMSRKNKEKKINPQHLQKEQQSEKNNTLIFGGVLLSISSIGLLIFILNEKVFHFK